MKQLVPLKFGSYVNALQKKLFSQVLEHDEKSDSTVEKSATVAMEAEHVESVE